MRPTLAGGSLLFVLVTMVNCSTPTKSTRLSDRFTCMKNHTFRIGHKVTYCLMHSKIQFEASFVVMAPHNPRCATVHIHNIVTLQSWDLFSVLSTYNGCVMQSTSANTLYCTCRQCTNVMEKAFKIASCCAVFFIDGKNIIKYSRKYTLTAEGVFRTIHIKRIMVL